MLFFCSGVEATTHLELKFSLPGGLTAAYFIKLYQTMPYHTKQMEAKQRSLRKSRLESGGETSRHAPERSDSQEISC